MKSRVTIARFLIRFGRFIQSLAIMVMRTDDLIEFSRQTYAIPEAVKIWGRDDLVDAGLTPDEIDMLDRVPLSHGRLLLLGADKDGPTSGTVGGRRQGSCRPRAEGF